MATRARDIAAPAGDTLTVLLTRAALTLDQVVVTGQATVISKRNAITSTSNVDSAELNRVPAPAVDIALAGKIAGANIQTNSGAPGGGAQIQIRGSNTVIGASDPLIVVDGVIYSNASIPSGLYTVTGSGSAVGHGPNAGRRREPTRGSQSERHRQHRSAEERGCVVDLRLEGGERRRHHHDEPRSGGQAQSAHHATARLVESPARTG